MSTIQKFAKFVCGLVLLPGLWLNLNAEEVPNEQILFVHLKITNGVVRLIESKAAPGHLKPIIVAEKPGDLCLELTSTNGPPVWTGVVSDPLVRRYEYEDPDHPGQLKVKEVKLDQAEFTVRVPGRKEARLLNIYRLEPPAAPSAAVAASRTRTQLGSIALTVPEGAR